jgi:uncharacterized protein (DUF2164 family)
MAEIKYPLLELEFNVKTLQAENQELKKQLEAEKRFHKEATTLANCLKSELAKQNLFAELGRIYYNDRIKKSVFIVNDNLTELFNKIKELEQ